MEPAVRALIWLLVVAVIIVVLFRYLIPEVFG